MARLVRRSGLTLALPALVGVSTLVHWLAARRVSGLWILPDEAIYANRGLELWRHGSLPLLHGEGAGYSVLYPAVAGLPLALGSLSTGYASLKLFQALVVSLAAVPVFFLGRRLMRPQFALLAAVLAVAPAVTLYAGFVMTEVLVYPLGALAGLAVARAVETATARDQVAALAAIAACVLVRVQAVILVAAFAVAVVASGPRRARRFWPLWVIVAAGVVAALARPGVFGAYAGTVSRGYPVADSARLTVEHLAYLALATGVVPLAALGLLLALPLDRAARAFTLVCASTIACVVLQVGVFAARFAPHLLGRDLALLPPLLFVALALWLDRGAPRPRAAVATTVLLVFALLVLVPWPHLVPLDALPDTFEVAILRAIPLNTSVVVAIVAVVTLALFALAPRAAPLAVLAALVAAGAVAARDVPRRVAFDQHELVGEPRDWVDRAARGAPVTIVYAGDAYWGGVWQAQFWNRSLRDVVSIAPSRVPGPMPQQVVSVPFSGRVPIATRYVAASDFIRFAGTAVAHVDQPERRSGGSTLWRLDGAPRIVARERGILANGDMTEPGFVRAYDCGGGHLELTLLPKETQVVTLKLDGTVVQRARIGGLPYWNGTVDVPPSAAPRTCLFEIDGESLLGSTRIEFVHR
jgi:hypothetical protein